MFPFKCFNIKTTTQAIGGDIRQAFSNVRVDREKLVIASRALGRRAVFHNFNYSLANDVIEGVKNTLHIVHHVSILLLCQGQVCNRDHSQVHVLWLQLQKLLLTLPLVHHPHLRDGTIFLSSAKGWKIYLLSSHDRYPRFQIE